MPTKKKTSARKKLPARRQNIDLGVLNSVWERKPAHNLPLRLVLVAKLIDRYVDRLLAEKADLSIAEWRVVAQLSYLQHGTVRAMARQGSVDPAEVSRASASLEKRGFVQREDNESDKRSQQFSLTKEGKAHFMKFLPHWQKFSETLLAGLSAQDVAATNHGLTCFARALLDLLDDDSKS
jgi:DNA-binding MarR family transcriptional regulator